MNVSMQSPRTSINRLSRFYIRFGAEMSRPFYWGGLAGSVLAAYLVYAYFSGGSELSRTLTDDMIHAFFALIVVVQPLLSYGYWFGKDKGWEPLDPVYTTLSPLAPLIVSLGFVIIAAAGFFGWW